MFFMGKMVLLQNQNHSFLQAKFLQMGLSEMKTKNL